MRVHIGKKKLFKCILTYNVYEIQYVTCMHSTFLWYLMTTVSLVIKSVLHQCFLCAVAAWLGSVIFDVPVDERPGGVLSHGSVKIYE